MKHHLFSAAAAACALLAVSCGKLSQGASGSGRTAGEVLLTVQFGTGATKVASQTATNEKSIQNVQIFVFRAGSGGDAGNLEIAASAGFDTPLDESAGTYSGITVKCSTGQREIWAVVNDSDDRTAGPDAVATKTEFLALTHELQKSSPTKLLMIGHSGSDTEPAVMLHEGREEITVPVHRLAASVILESVKNDFSSPAYQKAEMFRLENCYLLNVPGRINFGETSEPSALPTECWYARLEAETASPKGDLLYDPMASQVLDYGKTYTVPHAFYAYPNNCAPSEDASWCARATLLVLEATIQYPNGRVKYYYPVQLGNGPLLSNRQYRVNLTIHRPGSLDPNKPVTFDDVTPVITVTDWESGDSYNQEI